MFVIIIDFLFFNSAKDKYYNVLEIIHYHHQTKLQEGNVLLTFVGPQGVCLPIMPWVRQTPHSIDIPPSIGVPLQIPVGGMHPSGTHTCFYRVIERKLSYFTFVLHIKACVDNINFPL